MDETLLDDEEQQDVQPEPINLEQAQAAPAVRMVQPTEQVALPPRPVISPTNAPIRAPTPPYNPDAIRQDIAVQRMLRTMGDLPLDQAEKAVQSAMRFQAQRGYQRDLANGMNSTEALAKWAPTMFGQAGAGALSGAANFIRATRPPADKVMDIGGQGFLYNPGSKSMTALTGPKPTAPKPTVLEAQTHSNLLKKIDQYEKLLNQDPTSTTYIDPKGEQAQQIRETYLPELRRQAREIEARYPQPGSSARPAAPAAGGRVRVRRPDGKIGSVPASQLDQAIAEGYTRL